MTTQHAAYWFEIPVTDIDRSTEFYNTVLSTELKRDDTGPNPMAMFPTPDQTGFGGHIYPGKPSAAGSGNTIHLVAPDKLEDAMARVGTAGGEVVSPVIEIPAGRFAYCLDPDGNSFGLFNVAG